MTDLSTAANSPGAFKNVYDSIISLIELSKALPETAAMDIYRKKENSLASYQHKESAAERAMFRDRVHAVDTVIINSFNAKTGNDLKNVKMVYGSSSDEYTRSSHALAIAAAGTIYFRNGSYKPETEEGQKLLAHELTHVAQFKNRENYRNISKEQKEAEAESNEQNEAHESDSVESRKIDGVNNNKIKVNFMTNEKIKEVLENKIDLNEMNDFYIGKIIYKPNACGCININSSWFIYKKMDENCYLSLTGPFFENEIIYACSWLLKKEDLFDEYKTDDFFQKYMHNHFSSIEEIKEKYPDLNIKKN